RFLPGLRKLVDVVKEASRGETLLFIQIIDFLAVKRRPEKAKFFHRFLELGERHRRALVGAPDEHRWGNADEVEVRSFLEQMNDEVLARILSERELEALNFGYRERVTDMHLPHIRNLPRELPGIFAAAAQRARDAGFDGVELHYAHAYTMAGFLSRQNNRDDGYGGSPENRVRLPLEVFRAVRSRVGDDYAVGVRFLADEVIEGGSRVEDAIFYAKEFARAGFDFLSLSKGG